MKKTSINDYATVKCAVMPFFEFQDLISAITNGLRTVDYELDGIRFNHTDKAEEMDEYWNRDLNETISEYFQVSVTSVHADDADPTGIWICYK